MSYPFSLIVAVDDKFGIGKNGTLPWRIPGDLKNFKKITCETVLPSQRNAVIMGRKTWESLPASFQPLPARINCVISRNRRLDLPEKVVRAGDLRAALEILPEKFPEVLGQIFIIGGAQIFNEALNDPGCEKLYLTYIKGDFHCDVFFKPDFTMFQKVKESPLFTENGITYNFVKYSRRKVNI